MAGDFCKKPGKVTQLLQTVLRHCLKLTWFNSCTCNFYQKKKYCTFNSLVRNFCRPPPRKTPLSFKRKYFTCHAGNAFRDLSDVEPVSCSGSLFPDGGSVDRTSKHLATLTSNVVSFSLWTLNGEKLSLHTVLEGYIRLYMVLQQVGGSLMNEVAVQCSLMDIFSQSFPIFGKKRTSSALPY